MPDIRKRIRLDPELKKRASAALEAAYFGDAKGNLAEAWRMTTKQGIVVSYKVAYKLMLTGGWELRYRYDTTRL